MARKRKTISKKIRFEVFKRDKFTCQYCGKQAPDAILVIDHIHPVSKGGEDVMLNYTTSCDVCNSGKGARTLDDQSVVAKQRAEVSKLAERREQVEMMLEWHRSLADQQEYELDALCTRLSELFIGFSVNEIGRAEARKWLRKFSLSDLLSAMQIASEQYLRFEDGKATKDSVDIAWSKIPGIARVSKLPQAERDIYYIRGILRKRLSYVNEREAIVILTNAVDVGVDTEYLKQIARESRSWTSWCNEMDIVVGQASQHARS